MTMILLAIALALLAAASVVLLAMIFDWHPVENIKVMWRWWTVRLQSLSALVTGWLFFDPTAVLTALNLMPTHIRSQLPESVVHALSVVFGVIFVLNLLSIVARGVAQPKARK